MQQKISRGMSFVAGAVLLGVCLAHAQDQAGVATEFTPTIEQKVDARSAPAKVTTEDESALTSKGYVKIGTIKTAQPSNRVGAEVTEGLRAAALGKAASAGGDVVRFDREGAVDAALVPTGKMIKVCQESKTQWEDHGAGNQRGWFEHCVKWSREEEKKRVISLVSEGAVWRYDPKLIADIARTEEAAREAALKAEAPYKNFRELQARLDKGQYAEAELLLAHGAEVNARDKDDWSHLHYLKENDAGGVKFLLAHGADVNVKQKDGWTPLHSAAYDGHKELAELLLANKADVSAKNRVGDTPLHSAAMNGHGDVAELLLAHRAEVNGKGEDDCTPLHEAASHGHSDVAELLLAHGADVNARDKWGYTPLHSAASQGHREVAELLLAHGADVNARATWGNTPLHRAAYEGHRDVAELLLAHGADVNAKNNNGDSPSRMAENQKDRETVQLLRAHGGRK